MYNHTNAVLSLRIVQGMMEGHGWGMACGHIKAFGLFSFPYYLSEKNLYQRFARPTCLKYAGRTLLSTMYQPVITIHGVK